MSEMHRLAEASAVHVRVQYPEQQGKQGEAAEEYRGGPCGHFPEDSSDETDAECGFCQCECFGYRAGHCTQESEVKEVQVFPDNQH